MNATRHTYNLGFLRHLLLSLALMAAGHLQDLADLPAAPDQAPYTTQLAAHTAPAPAQVPPAGMGGNPLFDHPKR